MIYSRITSKSHKYDGLDCSKSKLKFTSSQQIKINKIIEKLNRRLFEDNYPNDKKPYKHKDIYRILRNLSKIINSDDTEILVEQLKVYCIEREYRIDL